MSILIPIAISLVAYSNRYKQVFRLGEFGIPSYR